MYNFIDKKCEACEVYDKLVNRLLTLFESNSSKELFYKRELDRVSGELNQIIMDQADQIRQLNDKLAEKTSQ